MLFKPLQRKIQIIDLSMQDIAARLKDLGIEILLTPEAHQFVLTERIHLVWYAKPVKRYLEQNIETPLARMILSGEVKDKDLVEVGVDKDRLSLSVVS